MKKRTTIVLLLAALTVLTATLAGCRSKRALVRTDDGDTPTERPEGGATTPRVPVEADTLVRAVCQYYTANFSCTVHDVSVSGQIRMVADSAIWVSVSKIIEVGRGLLTPGRVQAYVKLANRSVDCGWDELWRRWGVEMDFATLQSLLLGNPPPEATGRKMALRCDRRRRRPLSIELSSASGQHLSCRYGSMELSGGQWLPTSIEVTLDSRRHHEAVTLRLERIVLEQRKEMPFSIPKSYRPY